MSELALQRRRAKGGAIKWRVDVLLRRQGVVELVRLRHAVGQPTLPKARLADNGAPRLPVSLRSHGSATLIKEIKGKLDGGEDFTALAEAHSMDPGSKTNGGSLGWFKKSDMVGPFADAAFAADKGTVTDPVQTRFGWHIIKVEDKRDEIPLEEVREQIEGALGQELAEAYIEEIKGGATIVEAKKADAAAPAAAEGKDAEGATK